MSNQLRWRSFTAITLCFLIILRPTYSLSIPDTHNISVPPYPDPQEYHCRPPGPDSPLFDYNLCRGAAYAFSQKYYRTYPWTLTHRRQIHLPEEIPCPHLTSEGDCFFRVDYEATWNPPIEPKDVSVWGMRLARACVGPTRGSGGTFEVNLMGLRGPYTLKFEIGRSSRDAQDPIQQQSFADEGNTRKGAALISI